MIIKQNFWLFFSVIIFMSSCVRDKSPDTIYLNDFLFNPPGITRIVSNDTITKDIYPSGNTRFYCRRFSKFNLDDTLMEKFWYYDNSNLMAYNLFVKENLILVASYDSLGKIKLIRGCPFINLDKGLDTIQYIHEAPIGEDWVRLIYIQKPLKQ